MAPSKAIEASVPTGQQPARNAPRKAFAATLVTVSLCMRSKIVKARSKNRGRKSVVATKTATSGFPPSGQDHDETSAVDSPHDVDIGEGMFIVAPDALPSVEDAKNAVICDGNRTVPSPPLLSAIDPLTAIIPSVSNTALPTLNAADPTTSVIHTFTTIPNTFQHFLKLPVELRLKVWGHAADKPTDILQIDHHKQGKRWSFYRKNIPAVLQACKESRDEYLEKKGDTPASVANRRKVHPVYKLSFAGPRFRAADSRPSLVFFDPTYDTFWGRAYHSASGSLEDRTLSSFTGIADLDIARALARLVIPFKNLRTLDIVYLPKRFPNLKYIVALVEEDEPRNRAFLNGRLRARARAEHGLGRPMNRCGHRWKKFVNKDREGIMGGLWPAETVKGPLWFFKFASQMFEFRGIELPEKKVDVREALDGESDYEMT